MLYLFNVWAFDIPFSTIFRQIFSRMNPQERCDSTAPTCDTKIKTEAKPATSGKIWRAGCKAIGAGRSIINPPGKRTKDQRERKKGRAGQAQAKHGRHGKRRDNLIPGNHDWPIPALCVLSVQPSPTSPACCSHFWSSISDSAHPCAIPVQAHPCSGGFPVRDGARPGSGQLQPLAAAPHAPPCRPHASTLLNEEGTGERGNGSELKGKGQDSSSSRRRRRHECPFNNKSSSHSVNQSTPVSLGTQLELLQK